MTDFNYGLQEYSPENFFRRNLAVVEAMNAAQNYWLSFTKYTNDFMIPYMLAVNYFTGAEQRKLFSNVSPMESIQSYMDLLDFNLDISNRGLMGSMKAVNTYSHREMENAMSAVFNTVFNIKDGENVEKFIARNAKMMEMVTYGYAGAIQGIEPEYGFHFEQGKNIKVAETDRFILYQIAPTDKKIETNRSGKPVIIIPPYVLGSNILAFLPGENRSYTHCFANQGIPTYIRIMKDISVTPPVQIMTPEDDALDTKFFCETVKARHGKPVTINGYCQGGFAAVCDILSGELDGLVDALITCVSPMDGTRSEGFADFFGNLPRRFNELQYGTKTLPSGNQVADGDLMGWVYKLKSIENEFPVVALYRDMTMLTPNGANNEVKVSKSAAAINYWLKNERSDLPLGITKMSFDSYNIPVTSDGTLPIRLFDRKLNFRQLKEKGIKWLICYGEKDDLVEKETALAPLDYIDVEVSAFPKGHVAIATSWSNPKSACALHTRFGEKGYRGPVRFQLDLDNEISAPASA